MQRHLATSLIISLALAQSLFLLGVQNVFVTAPHWGAWLAVALLLLPAVHALTHTVLRPGLRALPPRWRGITLLMATAAGGLVLLSGPIGLPTNHLIGGAVGAMVALLAAGGFMVALMLVVVANPREHTPTQFMVTSAVLLAYLAVGMLAYDDYGNSVDEPAQRDHGVVVANHLASGVAPGLLETVVEGSIPDLQDYPHKYYGVAYQLPQLAYEQLNQLEGQAMWFGRHYMTFLFFFAGVLAFFRLTREAFDDWAAALVGTGLLILTPRIFAESMYNPKDTALLAAFCIALYFGWRLWRTPSTLHVALFAFTLAFATTLRVISIGLLACVVGLLLIDGLKQRHIGRALGLGMLTVALSFGFYTLISPASWPDPFTFFLNTFDTFKQYYKGQPLAMYAGDLVSTEPPPWHFVPVWMLITIPLAQLALFGVGCALILRDLAREKWAYLWSGRRVVGVAFLLMVVPIATVIVMETSVFNGWRHLTFVYGPMLVVATYGVKALLDAWRSPAAKRLPLILASVLLLVNQVGVFGWMAANHPYQNVYFNAVVEVFGGAEGFERDYWLLSGWQGLEYILEYDDRATILIATTEGGTGWDITPGLRMLREEQRQRLMIVPIEEADYIIETHRFIKPPVEGQVVYDIRVEGMSIFTVYTPSP